VTAVTTAADNTLRFIDAGSGAALGSVPTGAGPDSAWFEPVSGLVLVAAHRGGEVDMVDPKTKKSVGAITVGGALEEIASDPAGHVFVAVEDKSEVVELNLKTKSVVRRTKIEGCDGPTGLIYAPHVHALFGACDGKVAVLDARTLKVEKLLDGGKGPDGAMYDPSRGLVIIPGGQSGDITVIDAKTPGKIEVIGTYPTEKSARLGALDPKTGKMYLPAARFLPPAPGQRRGSMEPGSFHLDVVSPST
jgi:DNA-binding beta-propeller fold protein YncE